MKNNLLNPYVRGLADGANDALHINAERMRTPSVEPDVGMFLEFFYGEYKARDYIGAGLRHRCIHEIYA